MKILVAYASTDGQTHKIASAAADFCTRAGHSVDLLPLADATDVDLMGFDAAILAASVHAGQYQRVLTQFCAARADVLRGLPTLFLSVSLAAAGHDSEDWRGLDGILADLTGATGWTPVRVEQVAGAYRPSQYDIFRRFVMRRIIAAKDPGADPSKDIEYTDWAALDVVLAEWTASLTGGGTG